MTETTATTTRAALKAAEQHLKAYDAIRSMADLLEKGEARGLRIKCNAPDGSQRVVMLEDLGPGFEECLFETIHRALEFHEEEMADAVVAATMAETDLATLAGTPMPEQPDIDQQTAEITKIEEELKPGPVTTEIEKAELLGDGKAGDYSDSQ